MLVQQCIRQSQMQREALAIVLRREDRRSKVFMMQRKWERRRPCPYVFLSSGLPKITYIKTFAIFGQNSSTIRNQGKESVRNDKRWATPAKHLMSLAVTILTGASMTETHSLFQQKYKCKWSKKSKLKSFICIECVFVIGVPLRVVTVIVSLLLFTTSIYLETRSPKNISQPARPQPYIRQIVSLGIFFLLFLE